MRYYEEEEEEEEKEEEWSLFWQLVLFLSFTKVRSMELTIICLAAPYPGAYIDLLFNLFTRY